MSEPVLPKLPRSKLKSFDDLLTPEQQKVLRDDLAKMVQQRRMAEDTSQDIPMASGDYKVPLVVRILRRLCERSGEV